MQIIKYDPTNYEIQDTIKLEENFIFQSVKFPNGHYGIQYINPEKNINETILVTTEKVDLGPKAFIEFAATSKINEFKIEDMDKVELVIMLPDGESFREAVTGNEAKTITEKLDIAREIREIREEKHLKKYDTFQLILICILFILIIINLIRLFGGIIWVI